MKTVKRDVLIIGGGHASVPLIKKAGKWVQQGYTVTLITSSQYLYYAGMTPEYIGGVYTQEQVRIDLQALCLNQNIEFRKDRITRLETENRSVTTAHGKYYISRLLVFDIGSRNPNLPDAENISPTKPLHHIESLASFTEQQMLADTEEKQNLVIVGGGAAGIEIALNVSARIKANQRHTSLGVTVVEERERLLPRLPESLGNYVSDWLQKRGVDVRIKRKTTQIDEHRLILDDDHALDYDFTLWATGPKGQAIFEEAGLKCDKDRFLWIEDTLQHPEYPWLFAAGDCVRIRQHPDLEKLGVHAVKQGYTLARNVNAAVQQLDRGGFPDSGSLQAFKPYRIAPVILSTGGNKAILSTSRYWATHSTLLPLKHWIDYRWIESYQYPFDRKVPLTEKLHRRHASIEHFHK